MFIEPQIPLVTKEELDLEILLDTLIDNLSRIDVIRTEQSHELVKRFRDSLKDSKSLDIAKTIRGDLPRRKADLAKFFTSLTSKSRRDILRTISLYDWLSKIDESLDGISSIQADIREKVISLIRQISTQNNNTSVTDSRVYSLNLRKKDDILSSSGYTSLTSGSITNKITPRVNAAEVSIAFSRPVAFQNVYAFYSEEVTSTAKVLDKRYDTTSDALECVISISSNDPFSLIDLGIGIPFRISAIYDIDTTGKKADITTQVIGNNIQVNGALAIEQTATSISDSSGTNLYNFILPIPSQNIQIIIIIESSDSYPLKLFDLINSRGDKINSFSTLDSMIIDRRVAGPVYKTRKDELDSLIATGYLREVNTPSPIRIIEFKKCSVYSIDSVVSSVTQLAYLQSDLKIRSVDFHIDAYDPLQLIRYSIIDAENQKQAISPVNSNPVSPTKIVYETVLPKQVQLEITIPVVPEYLPVVHGVTINLGEVNL